MLFDLLVSPGIPLTSDTVPSAFRPIQLSNVVQFLTVITPGLELSLIPWNLLLNAIQFSITTLPLIVEPPSLKPIPSPSLVLNVVVLSLFVNAYGKKPFSNDTQFLIVIVPMLPESCFAYKSQPSSEFLNAIHPSNTFP